MKIKTIIAVSAFSLLAACTTTSQYTSGQDYVMRYQKQSAGQTTAAQSSASMDDDILRIASVEPMLEFPARIGLARIERGRLTVAPIDEAYAWEDMTKRLGSGYGEFVPVSPMIANMASNELSEDARHNVVSQIRAGAARQHLDYVLIYEVNDMENSTGNALSVGNLSILGLFVLPSRDVEVDTTASAMLLDVRNGYPYGSASTFESKSGISSYTGERRKSDKIADELRIKTVTGLTGEVEIFMRDLRIKRAEYKAAKAEALMP